MQEIIRQLSQINVPKRTAEIESALGKEKNPRKIDALVKEYKVLKNITADGLSPVEAFTRDTVPVMPSQYRSPLETPNGSIQLPDINLLLRDIGISNKTLTKAKDVLPDEDLALMRKNLYKSVEQLSGFDNPTLNTEVGKNPFRQIAGAQPKKGFFQRNLVRKRQDLSGRSVIAPDPNLDIDEIQVPYTLGVKLYEPFIKQELLSRGYRNHEAKEMIKEESDIVKDVVRRIGKDRPLLINRAPSIWQTSITAHNPIFSNENTIKVPNLYTGFAQADFDGDTVAVHVPVSKEAVNDANNMMLSKNLRFEGTGNIVSAPEHSSVIGLYRLSKTQEGRQKINAILPDEYKITKTTNKKDFYAIFKEIDRNGNYNTGQIMNDMRKLGDNTAFETGFTVGLSDLMPLTKERNDVIKEINSEIRKLSKEKHTQENLRDIYKKGIDKLSKSMVSKFKKDKGPLSDLLLSKARGSESQYRDLIASPIALMGGELTNQPIENSYIEGLTPSEFWQAAGGARVGVIGRAQDTALPGALAVEVLGTANQAVISDSKKEPKSIDLDISQIDDVLDRVISKSIPGVARKGDVVNAHTIQKAKSKDVSTLPVYTPLGSSDVDGGIPADAYGVDKTGTTPKVGINVGVISSQTLVEPLFMGAMKSFHTGASMSDKAQGYPRLKQLLTLPKELPKQATLSEESGRIRSVKKDELGGYHVTINDKEHYVSPYNKFLFKKGDKINRGDALSSGPIQPKQLAELVSLEAAQNYIVDELKEQVPSSRRRSLEVIVESLTRHGEVTDPGDSELMVGDIELISKLEDINHNLVNKIKYEVVFKGTNMLPQATQDWITQLNFRNLKRTLKKNVIEGASADLHSYSMIPGMVAGTEFGKGEKGKY